MKALVLLPAFILGLGMNLLGESASRFESGPAQVSLLELYTSEGCSSCPPAEQWLSAISRNSQLWKAVVPVAFHVDYWDNAAWRDRFSNREFTQRQNSYVSTWGSGSAYTPAFVLNGAEWRGWGRTLPVAGGPPVGKLLVVVNGGHLNVSYSPLQPGGSYTAEIVPLKMNATSHVTGGENHGRTLTDQFIAINLVRTSLRQSGDSFGADISCPTDQADALAVWVTHSGSLIPVQAAGGLLR